MRVPTPAELTCADPTAPCKLPNAFLADPPLEPVLAKTFELGTARHPTRCPIAQASLHHLSNDIQFVSASSAGTTGFPECGHHAAAGPELGMQGSWGKLSVRPLSYIDATFQTLSNLQPNN
jgi:hypothetical protein